MKILKRYDNNTLHGAISFDKQKKTVFRKWYEIKFYDFEEKEICATICFGLTPKDARTYTKQHFGNVLILGIRQYGEEKQTISGYNKALEEQKKGLWTIKKDLSGYYGKEQKQWKSLWI